MQHEIETLCRYRLERAKEDLQAARVNHSSGLFKASINRSYYAIFHSIRAVNILDGFDASKHSSVIAHFNQYYVHTGEFDRGIYFQKRGGKKEGRNGRRDSCRIERSEKIKELEWCH